MVHSKKLTIFYDRLCHLCNSEMVLLKQADLKGHIQLEDINASDFSIRYPHIDIKHADSIMHAQTNEGEILLGLDATYAAWQTVGKHTWLCVLRWPIIRYFADKLYLLFAKYRHQISYVITGQQHPNCACKRNKTRG